MRTTIGALACLVICGLLAGCGGGMTVSPSSRGMAPAAAAGGSVGLASQAAPSTDSPAIEEPESIETAGAETSEASSVTRASGTHSSVVGAKHGSATGIYVTGKMTYDAARGTTQINETFRMANAVVEYDSHAAGVRAIETKYNLKPYDLRFTSSTQARYAGRAVVSVRAWVNRRWVATTVKGTLTLAITDVPGGHDRIFASFAPDDPRQGRLYGCSGTIWDNLSLCSQSDVTFKLNF